MRGMRLPIAPPAYRLERDVVDSGQLRQSISVPYSPICSGISSASQTARKKRLWIHLKAYTARPPTPESLTGASSPKMPNAAQQQLLQIHKAADKWRSDEAELARGAL